MLKKMPQNALAFVVGTVAVLSVVVSWALVFGPDPANESSTILAYAVNYIFFGGIVGLFWSDKSIYGAGWLASPLLLVGVVSMLFAGISWSFVSHDVPRLAVVFLVGTIGCYLGQRIMLGRKGRRSTKGPG